MKFYTTSQISENISTTPEGYLVCVGVSIARTGEMTYGPGETPLEPDSKGIVIIQRNEKEVFRPETIASFEGKALTIQHPEEFVSPENWGELAKGILQNVRRGEGNQSSDLIADILVTDKLAIEMVKNGLRELSCGYEAEYTQTGIGRGIQTEIIGNHLALVESGRAGSSYAINDSKGTKMKFSDLFKSKEVGEAFDAAMKDGASGMATSGSKPGFVSIDDFESYKKEMKDWQDKMGKDASTQPTQTQPALVVADDKEEEEKKKAKDAEEEKKKMQDARDAWIDAQMSKEKEESEDDDEEEMEDGASCTGDTAARIEILSPGMNPKVKDAKAKAVIAAYATKDGKSVIDSFTGGKAPDAKNEVLVNAIFIGASEMLKSKRTEEFARTRAVDSIPQDGKFRLPESAEEVNALNAKFWGGRK